MKKNKKEKKALPVSASERAEAAQKKRRRIFDIVLTSVLVIVIVVCAVNIVLILQKYQKANNMYDDIQRNFLIATPIGTTPSGEPIYSVGDGSDSFGVDFKALKEYNSDIVGWLYSENTPISYPVAQAADNDYYVRRSLDREYLITGTIFVDYRCGNVGEDQNYIIYGHHMRNGTIFGSLEKYVTQEYYDAHPTFTYFTPDKDYVIDVFAGYVTDTNTDFFKINFAPGERAKLIDSAVAKSAFETNVEVEEDDTIVTFVTCSYAYDDARFILLGKVRDK